MGHLHGMGVGAGVCGAKRLLGLGGTAGLATVGGAIQELARRRDPAGVALGIAAGMLKVAGGLLALALIRPWGRAVSPAGCCLAPPGPPASR
jgi:hypothetical protein